MRMKPGRSALAAAQPAAFPVAFVVASLAALGGCASSLNIVGDPLVAPGKFRFLRCADIAPRLVSTQAREQELRTLMNRSAAGTGGSTVNVLVYQPEYQSVQSELQQLKQEAAEKQCPEPAKAAAKPADPKKPHS
jgi:hypothetical protein